jgi:cytochrome c oxidase assembly protein subunit 15
VSPTLYRRIVAVTLASLVFIMVTGAAVRLTGSGLGCSTWPSCEPDSFTPRSASDTHGMVEWVNRLITGAVALFTIAAVVGARLRRPYRADLFRWSLGLPAWVFANALVGALVVWLHLSPVSVIGHFVLSLAAVWNAVVLYERAAEDPAPDGRRRPLATGTVVAACRWLLLAAGLVVMTGTLVTGSGPHAGDERADRLDLEVGTIARIHGSTVVLFLALTLTVVWMARRGDAAPRVQERLRVLVAVLFAQAAIGYWQYFTGVPALLVGVHVLGAALVWIAVLRVWLSLSEPAWVLPLLDREVPDEGRAVEPSGPACDNGRDADRRPAPAGGPRRDRPPGR